MIFQNVARDFFVLRATFLEALGLKSVFYGNSYRGALISGCFTLRIQLTLRHFSAFQAYAIQFDFVSCFLADCLFTLLVDTQPTAALAEFVGGRRQLFLLWMLELSDVGADCFHLVVQLAGRNSDRARSSEAVANQLGESDRWSECELESTYFGLFQVL